ncbi:MAG: hypothetical protein HY782_08835 [Chloroflexi bacterium]|nr:hypothetical protein [Chloroflexota bacterium]
MQSYVPYRAFLLRLWQTQRGGKIRYRVSLESVDTRERKDLADLASLFAFLQAQEDALQTQGDAMNSQAAEQSPRQNGLG